MTVGMITRPLLAILLLGLSSCSAYACLNPIGQDFFGEPFDLKEVSGQALVTKLQSHKSRDYWTGILSQILDEKKVHPQNYAPTNHAVALAHLGRIKEAIAIFQEVERREPGSYFSAANLGTAYELIGDNEKALKWIIEGFRRNSDGHSGTEWLHVKILEAKIRMANESAPLQPGSVLDIRFDPRPELSGWYTTDHLDDRKTLKEIEQALAYQLHERLEFVKPPEPIVADLLADLSKVLALTREPVDAEVVFDLARSFGTPRDFYTKPVTDSTQPEVVERGSSITLAFLGGGVLLVLIGVGLAWRLTMKSRFEGM